MKFLLVMTLALSGLTAFAGGDKQKHEERMKQEEQGMSFAEKKEHRLSKLDKKVSSLSAYRSCIEGAENENALKSCKMSKETEIEAQEDFSTESDSKIQKEESTESSSDSSSGY